MKYHRPVYSNFDTYYDHYKWAMARRRPDSVLEYDRFCRYLEREDIFLYQDTNYGRISAVIGQDYHLLENDDWLDLFRVSHFAPASMKDGAKILRKMAKVKDRVIVFTLTDDLCDMLMACGFSPVSISFQMYWNGEKQEKTIFTQYGDEPIVRGLLDEFNL